MMKPRREREQAYLARTAQRLRVMSATQVHSTDADADAVRTRLENMAYGRPRVRTSGSAQAR